MKTRHYICPFVLVPVWVSSNQRHVQRHVQRGARRPATLLHSKSGAIQHASDVVAERSSVHKPLNSGQVRPRQGTEICNFGAPSPLEALHWIFCFFSSMYVQFSKTSPLKSGESSEKSSGENRVKSCHVCGCHGFFGRDQLAF